LEELKGLPGIGDVIAQNIIEYRSEHGPFRTLDDLDDVSGIGPGLLERISDLIEFGE